MSFCVVWCGWRRVWQLLSGLTSSYWNSLSYRHCISAYTLQKEEIGHFQSTPPLWVSRLQVIMVNCWICWRGEHYNHVFPDKAALTQTKSYPLPLFSSPPKVFDWIDLYANASFLICPIFIKTAREDVAALTPSADGEIALRWYPSPWPYIVLRPRCCIKSNKEPLQANVITLHPRHTNSLLEQWHWCRHCTLCHKVTLNHNEATIF